MTADTPTQDARALLRTRLLGGVKAAPLCRAIMGWLCDTRTDPAVVDLRLTADGRVWLRLSDEAALEPLCSFLEFLNQIRVLCRSVGMEEEGTQATVAWARQRLG